MNLQFRTTQELLQELSTRIVAQYGRDDNLLALTEGVNHVAALQELVPSGDRLNAGRGDTSESDHH